MATINGTSYKRGVVLVCGREDEELLFGKVMDLIVTPAQECLFILSFLDTYINRHFHCNVITGSHLDILVCRYNDLVDYYPLTVFQTFGTFSEFCFCVKYTVLPKVCLD